MLEWISDKLALASMSPFLRPTAAFLLTVVSLLISYFISTQPFAWIILTGGFMLAVWVWLESLGGVVGGFFAGLLASYLLLGGNAVLTSFRPTPEGCVMIDRKSLADCINDLARKAGATSPSEHGRH